MDRHGLLNILRSLSVTCHTIQMERMNQRPEWSWVHTPIIFPESRCSFCHKPIRSPGIWFLSSSPMHNRLYGMLQIQAGARVVMIQPSHPHNTGGGGLCLGRNRNGIELLAGEANLNDCPMGRHRVAAWYKRYWNHTCPESRAYMQGEFPYDYITILRELDKI